MSYFYNMSKQRKPEEYPVNQSFYLVNVMWCLWPFSFKHKNGCRILHKTYQAGARPNNKNHIGHTCSADSLIATADFNRLVQATCHTWISDPLVECSIAVQYQHHFTRSITPGQIQLTYITYNINLMYACMCIMHVWCFF